MDNERSPHILNASSNLLGICFVVLTSIKFLDLAERSIIDEMVAVAIIFFMSSCILSFLSIRGSIRSGSQLERVADVMFIGGLLILFVTALLFFFNLIS
jgi:hypothetical protein